MAAGLVAMVGRLTIGKKKYAEVEAEMHALVAAAEKLRAALTAAVADDIAAFDRVMAAFKLPKDSAAEQAARAEAVERATHGAAAAPLRVARDAAGVLGLAALAAEKGNLNAISDAGSAAHLALASLRAAAMNVRVNAAAVKDRDAAKAWVAEIDSLEQHAQQRWKEVDKGIRARLTSKPPPSHS
jgi:formiminotetrahydrofolate cyclodeaminase